MGSRRLCVVLSVAALMVASGASAASPTARLVYVRGAGAESCPDEPNLTHAVMTHLGYDPFRPFADTTLFVEVRRERDRFVGHVKMVDESGIERGARAIENEGRDCSDLAAAIALSMSIAIDPRSASKGPRPSPEPPAIPIERVEEAPPRNDVPSPQPEPPPQMPTSSSHLGVGLGVYGSLGEADSATVGARGSAEFIAPTWSAGLELRASLPTQFSLVGGGNVRTSLVGGGIAPCIRRAVGSFVPSMCAVVFVGRIASRTVDVPQPASQDFVHLSAGVRLGADASLSENISLRLAVDAMGTIAPYVLVVDGQQVYESPLVSALGGTTLIYAF